MTHEPQKYNLPDEQPHVASEPVATAAYAVPSNDAPTHIIMELSNKHKQEYLRTHLHPATASYLESQDWMDGKPFPLYDDKDEDSWIDEAEAMDNTDIIDEARIIQDRAAWYSVR